jgi:SAM-dependent methyltransferase
VYADHAGVWKNRRRPTKQPREGEQLTQRTFTREWNELGIDDALSFTYTTDERRRFIELEIGTHDQPLDPEYRTLDIGCGSGRESEHLAAVTGRHVFGIDLNVSIIRIGDRTAANPLAHNAVASVFALPFEQRSFDLVYSHGVLHHTYNTRRAFLASELLRKPGGGIYIWVYGLEDAQRGKRSRARAYTIERLLRRRIAGLPERVQDVVIEVMARRHHLKYRRTGLKRDGWELRHSRHSMRDRWTPPFAHRHSFYEVIGWFTERDLDYALVDPIEFRARLNRNMFGIGLRGRSRSTSQEPAR